MTALRDETLTTRVTAVGATSDTFTARRWATAEALVCAAVLLSLGSRIYLPSQVPLGFPVMMATAPAWWRTLRGYRHAMALMIATACALVFGFALSILALTTRFVARTSLVSEVCLVVLAFGGIGVVLWGRERLGTAWTGALVGLGMCLGAALHGHNDALNAWKGAWALPVSILVLSIACRRTLATLLALSGLAIVCVLNDTRALACALVLTLLLVVWQLRAQTVRRRVSYAWTGLTMGILGVLAYYLGSEALVRGLLGAHAQARSIQQIDQTGSLILGGRPEIAATAALIWHNFWGYGFGVGPRTADINVAKQGMAAINYDPNNGYVDRYMFGSGFELHSVFGDIWVRMGPVGLLLLLAVVLVLVASVAQRLGDRQASGLVLLLVLWTFWNLLFSPLLSSALMLTLALGLALTRLERTSGTGPGAGLPGPASGPPSPGVARTPSRG